MGPLQPLVHLTGESDYARVICFSELAAASAEFSTLVAARLLEISEALATSELFGPPSYNRAFCASALRTMYVNHGGAVMRNLLARVSGMTKRMPTCRDVIVVDDFYSNPSWVTGDRAADEILHLPRCKFRVPPKRNDGWDYSRVVDLPYCSIDKLRI